MVLVPPRRKRGCLRRSGGRMASIGNSALGFRHSADIQPMLAVPLRAERIPGTGNRWGPRSSNGTRCGRVCPVTCPGGTAALVSRHATGTEPGPTRQLAEGWARRLGPGTGPGFLKARSARPLAPAPPVDFAAHAAAGLHVGAHRPVACSGRGSPVGPTPGLRPHCYPGGHSASTQRAH